MYCTEGTESTNDTRLNFGAQIKFDRGTITTHIERPYLKTDSSDFRIRALQDLI